MLKTKLLSHSCIALCTSALLVACGGGNSSTSNSTQTAKQIDSSSSISKGSSVISNREFKVQKHELKDVKASDSLIINFSNSLNATEVSKNISLVNEATKENLTTSNSLSTDGRSIIIKPNSNLDLGAKYTLIIKKELKDVGGKSLKEDLSYPFTVSNSIDTKQPTVAFPKSDDKFAIDSNFALKFDEHVDIKKAHIRFLDQGRNALAFDIYYDPSTFTCYLTPKKVLDISSNYTIILSPDIKDGANNSLASDKKFTFTTKSTTESARLSILGDVKVDVRLKGRVYPFYNSAKITIKFSKELEIYKDRNDLNLVNNLIIKSTADDTEPIKDISYTNKTVTIDLSDLESNRTYELEIKDKLRARDGSFISFETEDKRKKRFDIAKEVDNDAPKIEQFIIVNGKDSSGNDIKLTRTDFIGDLKKQKAIIQKPSIHLVFSEAIKQDTISSANIKVQEAKTSKVVEGVNITKNPFEAIINFNSNLKLSTIYQVVIEDKVTDVDGNKLNTKPYLVNKTQNQIIKFDTKIDTSDKTAPSASLENSSIKLIKGELGYVDNKKTSPIVIKFNERLGDFEKMRLTHNVRKYVETPSGFLAQFIDDQTLHIIPALSEKFDDITKDEYTVILTPYIKDLNNNSLGKKEFTFKTTKEVVKDTQAPKLVSTNLDKDKKIAVSKNLVLTFDEDLKPASATDKNNIKILKKLVGGVTQEVLLDLEYSNKAITVKPISKRKLGFDYVLVIKKDGIEDIVGNKFKGAKNLLNADEKINFSTKEF